MTTTSNGTLGQFPPRPPMLNLMRVLKLWFGVSDRVSPTAYAFSGFTLMIVKYSVEALVIWQFTATVFWPWDFVNPLLSARAELLQPAPEWLPWALFLWTLPFLWIAVSMSVRRVADTGNSPWLGFVVLIPIINLGFMLAMCFVPSQPGVHWATGTRTESDADRTRSAVIAVSYSLILGGLMLWLSVYVFSTYGASLFLGTPFLMSATASYFYNRVHARSYQSSIGIGLASVTVGGLALLLFALEGLVCVAMAAPLMLPIGAMGGVMGKAIADASLVRMPSLSPLFSCCRLPPAVKRYGSIPVSSLCRARWRSMRRQRSCGNTSSVSRICRSRALVLPLGHRLPREGPHRRPRCRSGALLRIHHRHLRGADHDLG